MTEDVVLRQNLPAKLTGVRLIAYNIDTRQAVLSVDGRRSLIHPDDTVVIGDASWRVSELAPHDDARDEPRPNGWVTLTPDPT